MAELYIVGTPIGNLGDITMRALETLRSVDLVAAEDTRHTMELLTHFEIRKPMISCRAQNEEVAADKIIEALKKGQNVAYASDAGMPGISDPGSVLAYKVRQAGFKVVPIPGPSAFATLVSVAGPGGKTGRRIVVGRELTKFHEEIVEGSAQEVKDNFAARDAIKGEFAVFVAGILKGRPSDDE